MGFLQQLVGKYSPASRHADSRAEVSPHQTLSPMPLGDISQLLPLLQLQNDRQLIEAKSDLSNRTYQTLIVAVDIQRGLLWIDELFPALDRLNVGDTLTLRHHRKGEELVIRTCVIALGNQFGTQGIALMIPERIEWQPRRQQARFALTSGSTLVKIRPLGEEAAYGKLLDISVGGFCVLVSGNLLGQLRHGALLPVCEITLDNQIQIRCKGRVCAFRMQREPTRGTRICVQFVELPDRLRIELMNCLNRLENHSSRLEVA